MRITNKLVEYINNLNTVKIQTTADFMKLKGVAGRLDLDLPIANLEELFKLAKSCGFLISDPEGDFVLINYVVLKGFNLCCKTVAESLELYGQAPWTVDDLRDLTIIPEEEE